MDYFSAFCGRRRLSVPWSRFFWTKPKLLPGQGHGTSRLLGGVFLSALGIYEPIGQTMQVQVLLCHFFGFGQVLWKGMKKAIDQDGFLGLFTGGFTACATGVSAALIFSYLASLIFKPQMKE